MSRTISAFAAAHWVILLACASLCCVVAPNPVRANPPTLQPTAITGLRNGTPSDPSKAILLAFQSVTIGEDRTIAHFGIQGLSQVAQATMTIPIIDIDPGPPLGTFDVYYFYGDGIVSTDEWNAGTLLQSFNNLDVVEPTLRVDLTVDVTSVLNAGIQQNEPFLSFNFRAGSGTDRYHLGDLGRVPNTSIALTTVPEPSTLTLLALGVVGLAVMRRRRSPEWPPSMNPAAGAIAAPIATGRNDRCRAGITPAENA
jgi:PEP-CTERM motif